MIPRWTAQGRASRLSGPHRRLPAEVPMTSSIEGDYFEACTCAVSCPCIFLSPATQETWDLLFAWHISHGAFDGVALDGVNVVMAVRSPQQMTVGSITEAEVAEIVGMNGDHPAVISSPLLGAVTPHGDRLAPAVGVLLLVAAATTVIHPSWLVPGANGHAAGHVGGHMSGHLAR